ACACGLRTNATHSIPGSVMSVTYVEAPVISRGSSFRLTSAPMSFEGVTAAVAVGVMLVLSFAPPPRRGEDDGGGHAHSVGRARDRVKSYRRPQPGARTTSRARHRGTLTPVKRLRARLCARPRILFVGINPSLRSAEVGHHFAGPGNPFWRLLYAARLVPEPLTYEHDVRLPEWKLALTNI